MNSKDGYALVGPYQDASSGFMIATMSKTLSGLGLVGHYFPKTFTVPGIKCSIFIEQMFQTSE